MKSHTNLHNFPRSMFECSCGKKNCFSRIFFHICMCWCGDFFLHQIARRKRGENLSACEAAAASTLFRNDETLDCDVMRFHAGDNSNFGWFLILNFRMFVSLRERLKMRNICRVWKNVVKKKMSSSCAWRWNIFVKIGFLLQKWKKRKNERKTTAS